MSSEGWGEAGNPGNLLVFWLVFFYDEVAMQTLCLILDRVGRTIVLWVGVLPTWEISEDVATAGGGKLNNENHFVALCGNVLLVVGGSVAEIEGGLGTRSS